MVIHVPSGELAATGLAMPHSPRWHDGKLWLLNSGTGELGWIEDGQFQALCFLPGFMRGLAFAAGCAVVGLSKLRSPQFTGLPLEERLHAEGQSRWLLRPARGGSGHWRNRAQPGSARAH